MAAPAQPAAAQIRNVVTEANTSRLRRNFDQQCTDLAKASIRALDAQRPEHDFVRWEAQLRDMIHAIGGQQFIEALEFDQHIPHFTSSSGVLSDTLDGPTIPQARQHALLSVISNSLPVENEEGTPRKLIENCVHAGGTANFGSGDVDQAIRLLRARYSIPKEEPSKEAILQELLQPAWPKKLDAFEYQSMMSRKLQLATKVNLNPMSDSQTNCDLRALWWSVIAIPPRGSAYFACAEKARLVETGRETVAHRTAFVTAMCKEIRAATTSEAAAQKRRAAAAEVLGVIVDDDAEVDVFAAAQKPRLPMAEPGGRPKRHPCVKCRSTTHQKGFRCQVQVKCGTCNGDHLDDYCWIKHGVQLFNRQLPPQVAAQYDKWHCEYLAGTYKPLPGGPPRVRVRQTRGSRAAASVETTADVEADLDHVEAMLGSDQTDALAVEAFCDVCEEGGAVERNDQRVGFR